MPDSLRDPWKAGWAAGGAVVVIAASLLLTIIALARRITRQAGDVTRALDAARENTSALFALADVNRSVEQATVDLRAVREGLEKK